MALGLVASALAATQPASAECDYTLDDPMTFSGVDLTACSSGVKDGQSDDGGGGESGGGGYTCYGGGYGSNQDFDHGYYTWAYVGVAWSCYANAYYHEVRYYHSTGHQPGQSAPYVWYENSGCSGTCGAGSVYGQTWTIVYGFQLDAEAYVTPTS